MFIVSIWCRGSVWAFLALFPVGCQVSNKLCRRRYECTGTGKFSSSFLLFSWGPRALTKKAENRNAILLKCRNKWTQYKYEVEKSIVKIYWAKLNKSGLRVNVSLIIRSLCRPDNLLHGTTKWNVSLLIFAPSGWVRTVHPGTWFPVRAAVVPHRILKLCILIGTTN